ncbi:hypothetical protein C2S51_037440 [Perilla frutescens var. frutescens]|nr:hypothetical protein C2S51_037440 [Perilla frutescens var. frutescens]
MLNQRLNRRTLLPSNVRRDGTRRLHSTVTIACMQAEFQLIKKATMAFFFSVTTPLGIVLGIAVSNSYKVNSPRSLITEGLLNASSAGLLIYMALVDLLAADFMGAKMQGSMKLLLKSFMAAVLGAGGMSIMAIWA